MRSPSSPRPQIVMINGVGSVGKSSVARAIQQHAQKDFLHAGMDMFLAMLPSRSFGTPAGLSFVSQAHGDRPRLAIEAGPLVTNVLSGMRQAIAAPARTGNNVVIDEVMLDPRTADDYRALLSDCELFFVALHAPLEIVECRERDRGDRDIGLARWQASRVHAGQYYDLEIDVGATDAMTAARQICAAFDL